MGKLRPRGNQWHGVTSKWCRSRDTPSAHRASLSRLQRPCNVPDGEGRGLGLRVTRAQSTMLGHRVGASRVLGAQAQKLRPGDSGLWSLLVSGPAGSCVALSQLGCPVLPWVGDQGRWCFLGDPPQTALMPGLAGWASPLPPWPSRGLAPGVHARRNEHGEPGVDVRRCPQAPLESPDLSPRGQDTLGHTPPTCGWSGALDPAPSLLPRRTHRARKGQPERKGPGGVRPSWRAGPGGGTRAGGGPLGAGGCQSVTGQVWPGRVTARRAPGPGGSPSSCTSSAWLRPVRAGGGACASRPARMVVTHPVVATVPVNLLPRGQDSACVFRVVGGTEARVCGHRGRELRTRAAPGRVQFKGKRVGAEYANQSL